MARYVEYDLKNAPYCGYKKDGYRMYCDPQQFDGTPNLLYRNNGDGTFTDVSKKAGVANPAGKGLGVATGDIDGDGWPDIFVANDGVRNFLYHNRGDGTFADVTYSAGVGFDMDGKTAGRHGDGNCRLRWRRAARYFPDRFCAPVQSSVSQPGQAGL